MLRRSRPQPHRIVAALAAVSCSLVLASCGDDDTGDASASAPAAAEQSTTTCSYAADGAPAAKEVDPPADQAPDSGETTAEIATNAGSIVVTLDQSATPCTTHSFVSLAKQGYFDATQCHRLTTEGIFVLQCGDPTATGTGGPGYSFDDELSGDETYPAGTLAMANAGPNTNGSQFFIVYDDTQLPPSYTTFGQLDEAGLEVVKEIAGKGTAEGTPDGTPKEAVTIESITVG